MSRIDWSSRSGDEVETVAGILIRRRHNTAERITPSQGDGGLDIIVRDADGWIVYQIKKYATQPKSDQKAKIAKSFERVKVALDKSGHPLKEWHLVAPVNLTPPNLKWFDELTNDAGFTCTWPGLIFLDGLAAEFPDVIDYYFRDGKDRLVGALQDFANSTGIGLGFIAGGENSPPVADVPMIMQNLLSAHSLINKLDPHFKYSLSVDSVAPQLDINSDFIFAETRGYAKDQFVTVRIYEKYRGALNERPISIEAQIRPTSPEAEAAVRQFFEFGAPFSLTQGESTIVSDLPGGLGGEISGNLTISALGESPASRLRFLTRDGGALNVSSIMVSMSPTTSGIETGNLRSAGVAEGGGFKVEMRYEAKSERITFQYEIADPSGLHPSAVMPGYEFVRSMGKGRIFQIESEYGNARGGEVVLEKNFGDLIDEEVWGLVEAIAVLQGFTSEILMVPNLAELTMRDGRDIVSAAKLARGEELQVFYKEIPYQPHSDEDPSPGESAIYLVQEFGVRINDIPVMIGEVGVHAPRVKFARGNDGSSSYVRPVEGDVIKATARLRTSD